VPTPSSSTLRMVSLTAEALLRIENFQTCESAFGVVISGDPLGQMLGRHSCLTERNAQGVDFRIVADFHTLEEQSVICPQSSIVLE
jgi:hypothetical protein